MSDGAIIKTYVWNNGKCFFISTIDRDSSAVLGPSRFAETLVWDFDWKTNERGEIIYSDSAPQGSISKHQWIVECFHQDGKMEEFESEL